MQDNIKKVGGMVWYLEGVTEKSLFEEVIVDQTPGLSTGEYLIFIWEWISGSQVLQAEGRASTKLLRLERVWSHKKDSVVVWLHEKMVDDEVEEAGRVMSWNLERSQSFNDKYTAEVMVDDLWD